MRTKTLERMEAECREVTEAERGEVVKAEPGGVAEAESPSPPYTERPDGKLHWVALIYFGLSTASLNAGEWFDATFWAGLGLFFVVMAVPPGRGSKRVRQLAVAVAAALAFVKLFRMFL